MTKFDKYMLCVGIGGSLPPWIQFIKILDTHSSKDVSFIGYVVLLIALVSWFIYGIIHKDKVIIIANIVGIIGAALCIIAMLWY